MKRRTFGTTWWGQAWVEALEGRARLDPNRLPRGRTYARTSRVGELSVAPGQVRAAVQGSRRTPYAVRVRVRKFDAGEWDALLDAIAAEIGHTAALLDGELPPGVADDARAAGLDVLPGPGDVQPRCSCPDWADPCKHSAAVCYLIAERLDADPFALLLLRGLDREDVLARVRARRRASPPTDALPEEDDDLGVAARTAWDAGVARPPLPRVPLPPWSPGSPVGLPAGAPSGSGMLDGALPLLAEDAAERALDLALGEGAADAAPLRAAEDLARWAAKLLGRPDFTRLSANASVPGRALARDALAWRAGGRRGLEVCHESWQPSKPEALREGKDALGAGARVWRNRVTLGGQQLRLGRDGRWYGLVRAADGWDPRGAPDTDPARVAAELTD